jgi:hypothetical protein
MSCEYVKSETPHASSCFWAPRLMTGAEAAKSVFFIYLLAAR